MASAQNCHSLNPLYFSYNFSHIYFILNNVPDILKYFQVMPASSFFLIFFASTFLKFCSTTELTFELPDNAVQCFYEDLKKGIESVLEFQVRGFIKFKLDSSKQ